MNGNNKLKQNRHLAAMITHITLMPLVYYIPQWLARNVSNDERAVTFFAVITIVPTISYVALPVFFKLINVRKNEILKGGVYVARTRPNFLCGI